MKETYLFEYVNENEFKKLERSLKKYNMLAYKKLYFEFYPALKEGNFLGQVVSTNKQNGTVAYELNLPTNSNFSKVHGDFKLHYMVYEEEKIIILEKLTPYDILLDGHYNELISYKDVLVSKQHSQEDMFKINLLDMIKK